MPNITSLSPRPDQLPLINEKIAKLAAAKPAADIYAAFASAAQLASEALTIATELERFPGIEPDQMRLAVDFWYSLADRARTAALACIGGAQTLAEATAALLFLQAHCARKPSSAQPEEGPADRAAGQ